MQVISLFSGCGGMDLGFVQAGHTIVWANDIWHDAVETYKLNLGAHVVLADIGKLPTSMIPEADILIGGFPCQGFSIANMKRHADDKRNLLYHQYLRVLGDKKPKFFLAENVKGILSLEKGRVFETILSDFAGMGYAVQHAVLNAADFGVPQRRERVFLFGTRLDVEASLKFPPSCTHAPPDVAAVTGLNPWVGMSTALSGIPEPEASHVLENHEYTKYKLRFNGYIGHRTIDGDLPAPTITARGDHRGGVVIHHHPNNHRRLSAREVALIQSFPVNYKFYGCKTSVYRQVANAVPPLLARAVAAGLPGADANASPASAKGKHVRLVEAAG